MAYDKGTVGKASENSDLNLEEAIVRWFTLDAVKDKYNAWIIA